MNIKSFTTVSYCFFILLFSCDKNDKNDNSEINNAFSISPNNLTLKLNAQATSKYFTVVSDKAIGVNSDNPLWCNPKISNVSIDNLKIEISENNTFDYREAVVSVTNGIENKDIIIIQEGIQPIISVDKRNIVIQYGNQEFTLEINSNISINFELPEWITEKGDNQWQNGKKKYHFSLSNLPDEISIRESVLVIKPTEENVMVEPISISITQKAKTRIIAHRGYWQTPAYPQNSLASLKRAIDLGIYGSELDVWITKDGVVVLNHDATINGINLENSYYDDLKDIKLSNGEPIPTLEKCLEIIKMQKNTKIILEIKAHTSTENENRAVAAVLELVSQNKTENLVDYISFSENICNGLINNNPKNRVAFLNGNLPPEILKNKGFWGFDYNSSILKSNTGWIQAAKQIGLTTNVWTINTNEDFEYFIAMDVDYITTDYPQNLKDLISGK